MEAKILNLDELETITGGRQLTSNEMNSLNQAMEKFRSIYVSDPEQKKFCQDYLYEMQGLCMYYADGIRDNKFGSKEYLFQDFVKEYGSKEMYRFLYE